MSKYAKRRRRHNRKLYRAEYGKLEPRNLLAGITFQGGEVLVEGAGGNDRVEVHAIGNQIEVTLNGFEPQQFSANEVDSIRFRGHNGNDKFINNTDIDSFAYGHGGNDTFVGGGGNDRFQGGAGDDSLNGSGANDMLRGNEGDDSIVGGEQHDRIFGGDGNDRLWGMDGRDRIVGNDGDDGIFGGEGNDKLFGLAGNDEIKGHEGNDRLEGGTGNDRLDGGDTADLILGHDGMDSIIGGDGNDRIFGGNHDDTINGSNGDDQILGEGGDDTIRGERGNDSIDGGTGSDRFQFMRNFSRYSVTNHGSNRFTSVDVIDGQDTLAAVDVYEFTNATRTRFQFTATLNEAETESLRLLNSLRSGRDLVRSTGIADLSVYARNWSIEMSRNGFKHSESADRRQLLTSDRTSVAENIVYVSDRSLSPKQVAARFHELWVGSSSHYRNMINGDYDEIGIGIYLASDGWYGTHIFSNGL